MTDLDWCIAENTGGVTIRPPQRVRPERPPRQNQRRPPPPLRRLSMHTGYNVGGPMSERWGYGPVAYRLDYEAEWLLTQSKREIFNNLIN